MPLPHCPMTLEADEQRNHETAPITHWDSDVLQQEGANRLRDVVNKVMEVSDQV